MHVDKNYPSAYCLILCNDVYTCPANGDLSMWTKCLYYWGRYPPQSTRLLHYLDRTHPMPEPGGYWMHCGQNSYVSHSVEGHVVLVTEFSQHLPRHWVCRSSGCQLLGAWSCIGSPERTSTASLLTDCICIAPFIEKSYSILLTFWKMNSISSDHKHSYTYLDCE